MVCTLSLTIFILNITLKFYTLGISTKQPVVKTFDLFYILFNKTEKKKNVQITEDIFLCICSNW